MASGNPEGNKQLLAFVNEYQRLANDGNFDLLVPLIDKNAEYWFTDGTFIGISEIRQAFENTWNSFKNSSYTIANIQWLISTSEEAVCIYRFHWEAIVDGQKREADGRGTNVFRKIDERWKVVHEHLSRAA